MTVYYLILERIS